MSKKEKELEKIRNSHNQVRFGDIEKILLNLGYEKRQDGTSHAIFGLKGKPSILVPKPHGPFVLPVYVKRFLRQLDEQLDEPPGDQE
jgi:hypothetical protein